MSGTHSPTVSQNRARRIAKQRSSFGHAPVPRAKAAALPLQIKRLSATNRAGDTSSSVKQQPKENSDTSDGRTNEG